MQTVLTVAQMRQSDSNTINSGTSSKDLMLRAGRAVARKTLEVHKIKGPCAVVCGKGNNGGDGYVIADELHSMGFSVTVFELFAEQSPDAAYYRNICGQKQIELKAFEESSCSLDSFDTIFDCIFGTGFHGEVSGVALSAVEAINRVGAAGAFVVSVDINSGLNGNNGLGDDVVLSDLTVSVQNFQPGHFLNKAKDVMKAKACVDIGITPVSDSIKLFEDQDAACVFKTRKNNSSKVDFGYISLVAGCVNYSGAAKLAVMANAASRGGAGVVQLAAPGCVAHSVAPYLVETTLYPLSDDGNGLMFKKSEFEVLVKRYKTIAFGMGLGNTPEVQKALQYVLENYHGTLLLDADGLNALAVVGPQLLKESGCKIVITPHITEFSRLTGKSKEEILSNPIEEANRFAWEFKVTVLLKGPSTIITDGSETYIVDRGCAGMATAGSGDVLSGLITALLASSEKSLAFTAAAGAFIAGAAGELAQEKFGAVSMVASDTVSMLPVVIKSMTEKNNG